MEVSQSFSFPAPSRLWCDTKNGNKVETLPKGSKRLILFQEIMKIKDETKKMNVNYLLK